MRILILLGALAIATGASAQTGPQDGLTQGRWRQAFMMQMRLPGSDTLTPPQSQTQIDCFGERDVADPRRILLVGAEEVCTISDFAMTGGKIRLSASCTFAPDAVYSGDLTGSYSATAFDLGGEMRGPDGVVIVAAMKAERLGPCTPSA
ncbi:MAG: DUF3617 family protein [Pseudomonadota bacterium]